MTEHDEHNLPVATEDDTTAGNYFVANYPPFSFWTPERLHEAHEAFATPPADGVPLGLYVHIPFCRKRCHFCYFKVYTDRNAKQIQRYMDAMIREVDLYHRMPFVGGRKPKFVYFGGGTPSYLSAKQLTYLTDELKARLPWDEAAEVTFECEPGTLNEKKLDAIRNFGVTRLSLGIENFDDHILELNGRAHRSKEVFAAYEYARKIGFPQINVDLIAGMLDETDDNWEQCVERTIDLEPDVVTIYQMEIPFNTTIYKQMKAEGREIAPVAHWSTKRRWVTDAFDRLQAAGYTVTSAYTAVKDPQTKFVYRDELWQGADMLGTGVASFSHVNGTHFQNQHGIDPYVDQLEAGELPIYRAMAITDEEKLIRELVLQLKLGTVRRSYFQEKFDVDIYDRFADPLRQHAEEGYFTLSDDVVTVSRDGLLQIDRMLHDFFLPEHQDARYA